MKNMLKKSFISFIFIFIGISAVNAKSFASTDISDLSYIIGKQLFTYDEEFTDMFSGDVNTPVIMFGASTINTNEIFKQSDLVIYFKIDDTMWVNSIDGSLVENVPEMFEITHINGACVDPSCDSTTYANVSFLSTNPDDIFSDESIRVKYGDRISSNDLPKFLNRPGYKFIGWTLEGEDEEFDFSTPITEDITLETNWEPIKYNITFKKDDISSENYEVNCYYDLENNACSFIDYNLSTKQNYNFVGWTTKAPGADGVKAVYHVGDDMAAVLGNEENVTLYAVFEPVKYDVKFNLNGGTLDGQEVIMSNYSVEDTAITLPTNPTRVGYTFVEWQYNNNKYNNEVVSGGMTLTAKWEANTYTFKYGNNAPIVCKYDEDCRITAVASAVEGKTFGRWYVMNGENKVYLNDTVRNFTAQNNASYELIAEYTANYYNINYDYNGGKVSGNKVDTFNYVKDKTIELEIPTRDGYTFTGWTVVSGNAIVTDNKLIIKGAEDITIRASLEENTYNIKYYNNSEVPFKEETCRYSECKTIAALEDPDNDFAGWITDNGLVFDGEKALVAVDSYSRDGVINLRAKWTNKYRYIVSYDLKGGLFADSIDAKAQTSYLAGESIVLPIPTKEGYTFVGWTLNSSDIDEKNVLSGYSEDLDLVARWERISYTISYHNQNGDVIGTDTCYYDSPCELTKHDSLFADENMSLVGWSKEGVNGSLFYGDGLTVLNLTSKADDNIDLFVVYNDENVYYNVEFVLGDVGQFVDSTYPKLSSYKESSVITLPEVEVKNDAGDYEFDGWYINGNKVNGSFVLNENVTVEARWIKLNSYELSITNNSEVIANFSIKTRDQLVLIDEEGNETYNDNYISILNDGIDILVDAVDMSSNYETTDYNYYKILLFVDDVQVGTITIKTADLLLESTDDGTVVLNNNYVINSQNENFKMILSECSDSFEDITDGLVFEK